MVHCEVKSKIPYNTYPNCNISSIIILEKLSPGLIHPFAFAPTQSRTADIGIANRKYSEVILAGRRKKAKG